MATIKDSKLRSVKSMYASGMSAREIAVALHCRIDAVYYLFRKHDVVRRSRAEINRLQFDRKQPTFKLRIRLTRRDHFLRAMGIMIYWTEGSKWEGEKIVDFANSDEALIRIFLFFLRRICGIDERKLRAYLYCHSDQDPERLISFWSIVTGIPKRQFTKPYVKATTSIEKQGKMKHGLIHIRYNDKKMLLLLKEWIRSVEKQYS
jgi:hypothetical protein